MTMFFYKRKNTENQREEGGYWPGPVHEFSGKSDLSPWLWLSGGWKNPDCGSEKNRGYDDEDEEEEEEDEKEVAKDCEFKPSNDGVLLLNNWWTSPGFWSTCE